MAILKYGLGLGLGAVLLYFAFGDMSFAELSESLAGGDYRWLLLSILIGLFSHYIRAVRWRMQLRATGYEPSILNAFSAVMLTYMVNLALPRAGELARCSALRKSDKVPLPTGFGTVVAERVFDALILLVLIFTAFLLESSAIYGYLDRALAGKSLTPLLLLGGVGLLGMLLIYVFRRSLSQLTLVQRGFDFIRELIRAAWSIRQVRRPGLFIFYTLVIWFCYWLMTYVAFFSLPTFAQVDQNLMYLSLIVTIMGGIGMAMPVPGGTGPYHAAVVLTFSALLVLPSEKASADLGAVFALVIHTAQVLMMITFGSLGYLFLWLQKPKDSATPAPVLVNSRS